MAFVTKTWKDRLVEYAGRRKLKNVATGEEVLMDVSRSEGTVSQAGDAFSAANMNNLEQRIKKEFDTVNSSLMDLGGFKPVIDESTGEITGYKTKAGADTVFPFRGGFNGADIYMSGTNLGNLSKTELASKGQYFYGFEYDDSAKKFTVLYDGTYSYMLSTTSSYTSLYINDKLIEYATHNGQATIYNTIELKKGDTGYIISNNAGQFAQGYLRRIA